MVSEGAGQTKALPVPSRERVWVALGGLEKVRESYVGKVTFGDLDIASVHVWGALWAEGTARQRQGCSCRGLARRGQLGLSIRATPVSHLGLSVSLPVASTALRDQRQSLLPVSCPGSLSS